MFQAYFSYLFDFASMTRGAVGFDEQKRFASHVASKR